TDPMADEITVDARGLVRPGAYVCGACLDAAEDDLTDARALAATITDDQILEISEGAGLTGDYLMHEICRAALAGELDAARIPGPSRVGVALDDLARYSGPHGQIYARAECARVLRRAEQRR